MKSTLESLLIAQLVLFSGAVFSFAQDAKQVTNSVENASASDPSPFSSITTVPSILGADFPKASQLHQELWALSLPIPMLAYVARPSGDGPFPLVIMNHGESLDATARSFFPMVEFRDAALWFARRGYLVVVPIRSGFGSSAIDLPEQGVHGIYFGDIGKCSDVDFRSPGVSIASINQWVIDYMINKKAALPNGVIVVGQSGGGWGAIALSSKNPASIRAIVNFAGGRGGHIDGKANNNCAPDRLVDAAREFGRTARIPMLWVYTQNDSYFGPTLSRHMFEAYRAAGGDVDHPGLRFSAEMKVKVIVGQCESSGHWPPV